MELYEYVMHPFQALSQIYNYRRNPDVRNVRTAMQRRSALFRQAHTHLTEYFDSLYDTNRIALYAMYREMDADPLISAIVDACAYAATQPNSESGRDEAGRVVWCQSPNKDVQKILNQFLLRIEIDNNAFPIMRQTMLNGDQFEAMPGVRNEGIPKFIPQDPWDVAVVLDGEGRVKGYAQSNENGEPTRADSVIPFYSMLHFRMPPRYRKDCYGAKSAYLYNVREYWQEFQWVCDKLVIERLQRRPDRLMVLLDVGGMSSEDSFDICEEWRDRLYQGTFFNPQTGQIQGNPAAWGESRDIVLPKGADNGTQITTAPSTASSGPIDDLNFFLKRLFGALKFPPGYLGLDIGGSYDSGVAIEKQDIAFAQSCMRPQKAFLHEMTRACMCHLAYLNVNPMREENQFLLQMMPVSTFQEIERKELINLRFDLLDRAMDLGRNNEWNMEFWAKYVMTEYARFPSDFVDLLIKGTGGEEEKVDDFMDSLATRKDKSHKSLMESLKDNPKAREALLFFSNGAAMQNSQALLSRFQTPEEDVRSVQPLVNEAFDGVVAARKRKKSEFRAGRMMAGLYG